MKNGHDSHARYAKIETIGGTEPRLGHIIRVECIIRRGAPSFQILGLNRQARETAERIRAAILGQGFRLPLGPIIVSLSPADRFLAGAHLDLAIAWSVLLALQAGEGETCFAHAACLGEVGLNGRVKGVSGLNAWLARAIELGFEEAVVPEEQSNAVLGDDVSFETASELKDLYPGNGPRKKRRGRSIRVDRPSLEYKDLRLETSNRKAIMACAVGRHPLLLVGPPGSGKTTIARLIAAVMPPLNPGEAREVQTIPGEDVPVLSRPMRMPHHSITRAALVGGHQPIQIGEVTRAHCGVLILDEAAEFRRDALQALREPLESGFIGIGRGADYALLPARILLVATTNPCPCGYAGSLRHACVCRATRRDEYLQKLLGPLRDRIQMEVFLDQDADVPVVSTQKLIEDIDAAYARHHARLAMHSLRYAAEIPADRLDEVAPLAPAVEMEWKLLRDSGRFSMRALAGIRRLALTLCDIEQAAEIRAVDLWEAAGYRCMDDRLPHKDHVIR